MNHIFCLTGKSASGKDTIYQRLLKDHELGLKRIVPYTTRPMREGEQNGREYYFESVQQFEEARQQGRIIEAREYATYYGPWHYYTKDDGQIDLEKASFLVPSTLESYSNMRSFFDGRDEEGIPTVLPVYIDLDDGIRLQRALNRELEGDHPRYEEMCRRFLSDQIDFSDEKIREAGITRRFINDDLDRCTREIREYILGILHPCE